MTGGMPDVRVLVLVGTRASGVRLSARDECVVSWRDAETLHRAGKVRILGIVGESATTAQTTRRRTREQAVL